MKILNVVLSILILLLAIAAAVFSYLLFEKRETMTKGWEQMSLSINKAASAIDSSSGTSVASSVNKASLDHKKFAQLSGNLGKFNSQVNELIAERDKLAETVMELTNMVKADTITDVNELMQFSSSAESQEKAMAAMTAYKARQDAIINFLEAFGKELNVRNVSAPDYNMSEERAKDALMSVGKNLSETLSRLQSMETVLKDIGSTFQAQGISFNTPNNVGEAIKKIMTQVKNFRQKYEELATRMAAADKVKADLEAAIAERDDTIEECRAEIDKLNTDIARLHYAINPDEGGKNVPALWADGSVEARKACEGKVIELNDKFGFIVIDLSKNTVVKQVLSKTYTADINPMVEVGQTLTVARTLDDGKDAEFIAKIKIVKVEDNCAIAELDGKADSKVRVGDSVFYAQNDLDAANLMK